MLGFASRNRRRNALSVAKKKRATILGARLMLIDHVLPTLLCLIA